LSEDDRPEFATAVRGYDRQQVDDYVRALRDYVDEAHGRAKQAEQRLAEHLSRSAETNSRVETAPMAVGPTGATSGGLDTAAVPARDAFAALGDYVAGVLRAAEEAAQARTAQAEREAVVLRTEVAALLARRSQTLHEMDRLRTALAGVDVPAGSVQG